MGSKYYYVLNGQGDIVQIRSSTNAFVAEYHYDAWGKLLYISDNSGNKITSTSSVGACLYPAFAPVASAIVAQVGALVAMPSTVLVPAVTAIVRGMQAIRL